MNQPNIKRFNLAPKVLTRIEMPDGSVYGIVVPKWTKQEDIDRLIDDLITNPNSRRKLDVEGGYNLINPETGKRARLFKESFK